MSGIDGKRRDDRIQSAVKIFFEKSFLLTAHFFRADQVDPLRRELRHHRVEETEMLLLCQFVNSL